MAASALGGLLGRVLSVCTKGIEFVMTALFVVMFVGQWQGTKKHRPALIGVGAALLALLLSCVPAAFAEEINSHTGWNNLTEGKQNLTGWEALIYSRLRKLDDNGDFSRTSRQRKLLEALLDRYRSIGWRDLLKLMDKILPLISTDLNYGQLVLLAMEILPKLPDSEISSQRIPADGAFRDEKVDGMAVLVPDLEANREMLRNSLLG